MKLESGRSVTRPIRRRLSSWTPVQVAAVCYRRTAFAVEFLLVNTSAGKWTFPKGRPCPWLSASEAAAREALEEAGVRGRIQESCFAHYLDLKRTLGHDNRSREILIEAYLLEVRNVSSPHETDRNPTWFSAKDAKQRLAEQRTAKYARGLEQVIDAALQTLRQTDKKQLLESRRRLRWRIAQR
ncbi:MAG TPA: NUDIX domain-containing protein [Candidatus Angelobacter sp.]|nr:NUDIX domain-containing protein [Candidatus Angelobacter sp.]